MEPPRTMETGGRTHQKKKAPPLVHSPLGERGGPPSSSYSAKPNGGVKGGDGGFSPSPLNPYYQSEYETLWREAEDRAAALALELKFLRDKDDKAKEEVEVQRTLLRNAAAEVRSEVLSMKKNLEDKEREKLVSFLDLTSCDWVTICIDRPEHLYVEDACQKITMMMALPDPSSRRRE